MVGWYSPVVKRAAVVFAVASFVAPVSAQTIRGPVSVSLAIPVITAPAVVPSAFHAEGFSTISPLAPSLVPPVTPVAAPVVAAPALTAAPLPILFSAAAESDGASAKPAEPAKEPASPEKAAENAGALFDGTAAAPPAAPGVPSAVPPANPPGSGLHMARPEHDAWLAAAVGTLALSRTGRRVLRDIDSLSSRRGRPILLDVKAIGNNGEFRYDSDMLIMDSGHLKRDPYQSAPILAHELQHVLQRAMELPVDALELEIESYTVESRVWTELGVEPAAGTFARDARKRLRKDVPGFVKWLSKQYKNNIALYGSTMDEYIAELEKNLVKADKAEARTRKKIKTLERVLESMKKNGMKDEAIEAHRREDLEPLERSLIDGAVNRGWIERDLRRLKEPAIRESFRVYARGVIRRARSLSHP